MRNIDPFAIKSKKPILSKSNDPVAIEELETNTIRVEVQVFALGTSASSNKNNKEKLSQIYFKVG